MMSHTWLLAVSSSVPTSGWIRPCCQSKTSGSLWRNTTPTLSALTIQVLRIVEDSMPYGKDIFDDFVANRFQSPRWVFYTIRRREK